LERFLQACATFGEKRVSLTLPEEVLELAAVLLGFNKIMNLVECSESTYSNPDHFEPSEERNTR
jgi:hypothetical protein